MELTNENITYPWVIDHINRYSRWETKNLSVKTIYDSEEGTLEHKFLPGHGFHYFYYKDRWINVERRREKRTVDINDEISGRYETKALEIVNLSTW
uniref:BCS1 N-terminal domain-containing protein n=1 Tax=Acrobeloides nanus TaxID=290746 RepID=A0A914CUB1_9BILA